MTTRAPSPTDDATLTEAEIAEIAARSSAALASVAGPLIRHISALDVPRLLAALRAARAERDALERVYADEKTIRLRAEAEADAAEARERALRDALKGWLIYAVGAGLVKPKSLALRLFEESNAALASPPSPTQDDLAAELLRLRKALRIVAGYEQCADNLMSKVEIARAALEDPADGNTER